MAERILIIDDETDVREAMADAVASAGYEVLTAGNGEDGLKVATTEHPDLILLDLIMPVMDGHAMLRRLRQDTWGKSAKVVVLTSMDDVDNVAIAHEGNIADYVIKTHTSLDELIIKVREALFAVS